MSTLNVNNINPQSGGNVNITGLNLSGSTNIITNEGDQHIEGKLVVTGSIVISGSSITDYGDQRYYLSPTDEHTHEVLLTTNVHDPCLIVSGTTGFVGIGERHPSHRLTISASDGGTDPVRITHLNPGGNKFVTINDEGILKKADSGTVIMYSGSQIITGSLIVSGSSITDFGTQTYNLGDDDDHVVQPANTSLLAGESFFIVSGSTGFVGVGEREPSHRFHVSTSFNVDPVRIENLQPGGLHYVTITNEGVLKYSTSGSSGGSTNITGSQTISGSQTITGSSNISGSSNVNGSQNITGSLNINGTMNQTGSMLKSGSFIHIGPIDTTGDLIVTGSQQVSGSITLIGDNGLIVGNTAVITPITQVGNLTITGSQNVTGSQNIIGPVLTSGSTIVNLDYGTGAEATNDREFLVKSNRNNGETIDSTNMIHVTQSGGEHILNMGGNGSKINLKGIVGLHPSPNFGSNDQVRFSGSINPEVANTFYIGSSSRYPWKGVNSQMVSASLVTGSAVYSDDYKVNGFQLATAIGFLGYADMYIGPSTSGRLNIDANNIKLDAPTTASIISASGDISTSGKILANTGSLDYLLLTGLPTTEPHTSGALWVSGSGLGSASGSKYLMVYGY
jgi:hypothetical protein